MREYSDTANRGGDDSSDESIHPPSCSTCPDDDEEDHRGTRRGRGAPGQGPMSGRRMLPPFDREEREVSSGEERARVRERRRERAANRSPSSRSRSRSPTGHVGGRASRPASASKPRKYAHASSSGGSGSERGALRRDVRQRQQGARRAASPNLSDRRPGPLREPEAPPPWVREDGGRAAWDKAGGMGIDRRGTVGGRQGGGSNRGGAASESEGSSVGRGRTRPPVSGQQESAPRPRAGGGLASVDGRGRESGRGEVAHAESNESDDMSDVDRRHPPLARQPSGARVPRPASAQRLSRDSSRGSSRERGAPAVEVSSVPARSHDGSASEASMAGRASESRPKSGAPDPSGVAESVAVASRARGARNPSYGSSHAEDSDDDDDNDDNDDDDDDGDGHEGRGRGLQHGASAVPGGQSHGGADEAISTRQGPSSSESERSRRHDSTRHGAGIGGGTSSPAPRREGATLSTGTPIPRPFNEKDEYAALQHVARHPDEALPMRIAYQHLDQLAVSAAKISAAVEADRRMLQRQVAKANLSQLRLAFRAWRLSMYGDKEKQEKLRRAVNKMARGRLLRTLEHWREVHGWANRHKQMQGQIKGVLRRKKALRLFKAWRAAVEASTVRRDDRWREKRTAEEMHARFSSWLSRRAAFLIYKRRVARVFAALDAGAEARREKRRKMERAVRKMLHRKLGVAFEGWHMAVEGTKKRRSRASRAILKMLNRRMAQAFAAWWDVHQGASRHKHILRICLAKMNNRVLASAWAAWVDYVDTCLNNRAKLNNAVRRMANRRLAAAFYGLLEITSWQRTSRSRLQRALKHMLNAKLSRSWRGWVNFLVISRGEKGVTLQERVALMEEQLGALREENERFRRVIDSGEWGQARVAEMVKAGELLMGERDALARLLEQLRAEYVDAAERGNAQADEIRALKQRMLAGNFAQRNKMLVRGASSFNALVRALKADVLEAGADPEVLYSLDRLSLDRVDVFPDGELHVQAVNASKLPWATPKAKERSTMLDSSSGSRYGPQVASGTAASRPTLAGSQAYSDAFPTGGAWVKAAQEGMGSAAGLAAPGHRRSGSGSARRSFSSFADSPALVAGIKQRDRMVARQAGSSARSEDGQARGARPPGRSSSGGQETSQRIVEALSSLTPEEVTALQTELEKTSAGFSS